MTRLLIDKLVGVPGEIDIEGEELHYLTRVRRHRPGDCVEILDTRGARFAARVVSIHRQRAVLELGSELPDDSPVSPVTLIVAVPKRNLLDDVIRKASEIGVERIVPVVTSRTVARPGAEKVERWERIAREALRQCGRKRPLIVSPPHSFEEAVSQWTKGTRVIFHYAPDQAHMPTLLALPRHTPPIIAAIGPEGGFTDHEVTSARRLGYIPVKLDTPVMRVETAAIAAAVLSVAILQKTGPH